MAQGSEPDVDPAEFSEITPVVIGTAIWALLFVVGLLARHDLARHGREWWVWSAGFGVLLGFVGLFYLRRRQARLAARAARPSTTATA